MEVSKPKEKPILAELAAHQVSRRKFIRFAGLFGATATIMGMSACNKDDDEDLGLNLGSGDTGVLNYAYALEQLEAAFYTTVIQQQYSGITAEEVSYLTDIRDHEVAHREFFKNALGANAIGGLEVDFSSINFASRDSVLGTARAFEDLGVSAYNGAGKLLTNATNLLVAGKIVSVEARHAALIRDLISFNSFADNSIVNPTTGFDLARTPSEVLDIAKTYVKTKLNATNLPTS